MQIDVHFPAWKLDTDLLSFIPKRALGTANNEATAPFSGSEVKMRGTVEVQMVPDCHYTMPRFAKRFCSFVRPESKANSKLNYLLRSLWGLSRELVPSGFYSPVLFEIPVFSFRIIHTPEDFTNWFVLISTEFHLFSLLRNFLLFWVWHKVERTKWSQGYLFKIYLYSEPWSKILLLRIVDKNFMIFNLLILSRTLFLSKILGNTSTNPE